MPRQSGGGGAANTGPTSPPPPAGASRQALPDLWPVAMAGDVVGREVVGCLGKRQLQLGFSPRAADSRLGIGDEMPAIHHAGFEKRQEAEQDRGRIAAGIGHQARASDPFAVQLAQAIHRLADQLGRGVLHLVPALPFGHVAHAAIGGEVSRARPRLVHRHAVRRGEKNHVAATQGVRVRRGERELDAAAQAGKDRGDRRSGLLARGDRFQLHLGMAREQPQQPRAAVPGPAYDARLDHVFPGPETKKPPEGGFPSTRFPVQRFEYCLRRRALCRPTFFRSTSPAPRVTRRAALKAGFSPASYSISARVIPWRTAPACPLSPPPPTLAMMSKADRFFVTSSGWRTIMRPVSRAKNSSTGLPLTVNWPLPGLRNTRATALLRRPV